MPTEVITRKRPVAGIGYGQKGYWGNRHFSTIELAEAAFNKHVEELRKIYGKPGFRWTGKYLEEVVETPDAPHVVKHIRFTNLRKDGTKGGYIHKVHLYKMDEALVDRFMADPFYAVEA